MFATSAANAATIVIVNKDGPGVGFNDPTPAAPIGGNAGTTLGQQRLNVFQDAANIWGSKLSSAITIKIAANFGPLTPCSLTSGVLGSASPVSYNGNFANAPRLNTWYPVALASSIAGVDLAAGNPDGASIAAHFNSSIGTAGCLPTLGWYLGLDGNHGDQIDLETVLLHEFGHGLGFTGTVSLLDGSTLLGFPDIFAVNTFDNTSLLHWNVMSNGQRFFSTVNSGNVVFDGSNTTAASSILSAGKDVSGHPLLYTPSPNKPGSSIYHFDRSAMPNLLMEPVISSDLTHNVDLPNDLTMKVMLDLGWALGCVIGIPTNVNATASSANSVALTWGSAACATEYHIYRSSNGTSFTQVGTSGILSFTDMTAMPNTAYLYTVRAFDSHFESADSNKDLATTVVPTNVVVPGATVAAIDFTELRAAVDAVERLAGITNTPYADGALGNTIPIRKTHIDEPLVRLNAARGVLGLGAVSLSGGPTTQFVTAVRASDVNDLRDAVR